MKRITFIGDQVYRSELGYEPHNGRVRTYLVRSSVGTDHWADSERNKVTCPAPPYGLSAVVGQALGWTNASSEKPRRETTPRKLLGSRAAVVPTRLLPSRVVRRLACDGCEADGPRRPRAAVDGGGARKETSEGGDMGCVR